MVANSRFPVAVHILTALAYHPTESLSSPVLAESVGTNPVVIRRLVGLLQRAGLVEAHAGKLGGVELARRPETITLLDVFRAVEGGSPFIIPDKPEDRSCEVSCAMKRILASILAETDRALSRSLEKVRLSDLVREIGSSKTPAR
jgi:Rrf2 family protein